VAIQAWLFGATAAMNAFVLAFSVPSMFQVVLLTGPLSGVLVPTLTAYRHDHQALNNTIYVEFLCKIGYTLCQTTSVSALPFSTEALATRRDRRRRACAPKRQVRLHLLGLRKAGQVTSRRRDASGPASAYGSHLAPPLS
jgi:peptidoglycan biosynthesis protein MviN/MurJ (putative lipid II flippase)